MKLHRLGLILGFAGFFSIVISCGNSGDETTQAGSGGVGGSAGASGNGGATSDSDSGDGGSAGASAGGTGRDGSAGSGGSSDNVCPDAGFEDGSGGEGGSGGEPVGNPPCAGGARTGACCRYSVDHSCLNSSGAFCGCNPRNMWTCGNI